MELELNREIISERADAGAIEDALQKMIAGDVLVLHRPLADFIQVEGTTERGFTLNVYDDAEGTSFSSKWKKTDANTVAQIMARFVAGGSDWLVMMRDVKWQSGAKEQEKAQWAESFPGGIGLIALVIFGVPYAVWAVVAGMIGGTAPIAGKDVWKGLVAIVLMSAYVGWIELFFRMIRPDIAQRLGKRMRTEIVESQDVYDMTLWVAPDGTPMNRVLVFFLDIGITIAGVVVPLGLPAVILFVLFNK